MTTPTLGNLRAAIQQLLTTGSFMPATYLLRNNRDNAAYEAYIFMLVLRAIQQLGGTAELRSINSPYGPPPTFVFRGVPGFINSGAADYGYALCSYNGREFEVHIDVYYRGSSQVLHEIDISIVDRAEAIRCRQIGSTTASPRAKDTRGAIECKFYDDHLGTVLIRTFVGLKDDMGALKICRFVSNQNSQLVRRYCSGKPNRPRFNGQLSPLNANEEQQFLNSLVDDLRHWLG